MEYVIPYNLCIWPWTSTFIKLIHTCVSNGEYTVVYDVLTGAQHGPMLGIRLVNRGCVSNRGIACIGESLFRRTLLC